MVEWASSSSLPQAQGTGIGGFDFAQPPTAKIDSTIKFFICS